jgi:hypothetical protein
MGYTSSITIAVRKDIYLKCQLLENIPKSLPNDSSQMSDTAVYWEIEGWKWDSHFPEVAEIIEWFEWLDDPDENPSIVPFVTEGRTFYKQGTYGAVRLGEENTDIEEWGDPYDFDLFVNAYISTPFN